MTVSIIHKANSTNETSGIIGTNGTNGTNEELNGTATTSSPISGATKLQQKVRETNNLIVCPGVYDGLSARIALSLGFEAMYMVRISTLSIHPHLTSPDWRGNNSFAARKGGSRARPIARYEDERRDDCSFGTIWPAVDCGYGHRIRWYVAFSHSI